MAEIAWTVRRMKTPKQQHLGAWGRFVTIAAAALIIVAFVTPVFFAGGRSDADKDPWNHVPLALPGTNHSPLIHSKSVKS